MNAFLIPPILTRFRRPCRPTTRVCRCVPVRACDGPTHALAKPPDLMDDDQDPDLSSPQAPTQVEIDPTRPATVLRSAALEQHAEKRASGLIPPFIANEGEEWVDSWTVGVLPRKARELKNQYSRLGILIEHNFDDFVAVSEQVEASATIEDLSRAKARALYHATGLPSMAETHDLEIDAPESGSRINKTLQQAYYTRNVEEEADAMIERVRPISDENRACRFGSVASYFDGEREIVTYGTCVSAIVFANSAHATIATACAFDDMYKELSSRLGLSLYDPTEHYGANSMGNGDGTEGKKFVGAVMLRERLMREGKLLDDGIVKVSSFLNHMVDVELMEECGVELAERLRRTGANKLLTVESTGLIPALPVARTLGIPLIFARKSRPITISDSFQTSYRSATKGTQSELVVSCEYLHAGDRVLIIDDFLAGGSTAEALFKLARMAHAKVVGVGVLIEKMSSGGRAFLSGYSVPVESLAKINIVKDGTSSPRLDVIEEEVWGTDTKDNKSAAEDQFGDDNDDDLDDVTIIGDDDDDDDDDDFEEFDDLQDELIRGRK